MKNMKRREKSRRSTVAYTMKKYSLVKHSDSIKLIILIINTCHQPLIATTRLPNCCVYIMIITTDSRVCESAVAGSHHRSLLFLLDQSRCTYKFHD